MFGPSVATLVGGSAHSGDRALHPFGYTLRLRVVRSTAKKVNACLPVDFGSEGVGEIGAAIRTELPRPAVAAGYMGGKGVEDLLPSRITKTRDYLDPSGEGVGEYHYLIVLAVA